MALREKAYFLKTRILNGLCRLSAGARGFAPEQNILIFGNPRSGSTWVMELIESLSGTVSLWEPLHLRKVEEFRELGFSWRQYIPEDERWRAAEETFEKLFKGELLNFWLSSRTFPLAFCRADRMVIKFIRANGLLPWLTRRYDFEKAPIYLLRHPFAAAASQLKEGSWSTDFQAYTIPESPYNDVFQVHADFLSTLKTRPEAMVATWCINNKVVLENHRHDIDWITLHYENLLLNPEERLQAIFDRWNIVMPEGILRKVGRASSTTKELTFRHDLKAQLSKWRGFFDPEDVSRMQRVLDYFEINIYSTDLLPKSMEQREKELFA